MEGKPQTLEHNDIRWTTSEEIPQYEFCPADETVLRGLQHEDEIMRKFVCDRISKIIKTSGKICITKILSDKQSLEMLEAELTEELANIMKTNLWRS